MLLGVVFYGNFLSNWLFGLAMGLHAFAVFDVLPDDANGERPRWRVAVGIFLILLFVLYVPLYQAVTAFVEGVSVTFDTGSKQVRNGDFLLVDKRDRALDGLRRGDVAVFHTRAQGVGIGVYYAGGQTIDRVIGLPGDRVEFADGVLKVNGDALTPERLPLNSRFEIAEISVQVPEGRVLIIQSTLQIAGYGNLDVNIGDVIRGRALVAREDLVGRAFMVYKPFRRIRTLRLPTGQT